MGKKKHIFDRMVDNYSKRWFPAIGKKVFPILVYSAYCQGFQKYEVAMHQRFRLHLLLYWKQGVYKSSIIMDTMGLFGLKSNVITSSSAAAMRGSFTEKAFVPPEFRISEVILFPELMVVISGDKEILGQLMAAMEESEMRIALVKIGTVSQKVLREVRKYGCDIQDGRLVYRNKATIISATHNIDQLAESNREAFLSRQYLLQIEPSEIPMGLGWKEMGDHYDEDLYIEFAEWFQERNAAGEKPDLKFGRKVIKLIRKNFSAKFDPDSRQMNDIRKMVYARHGLFPDETIDEVAMSIRQFIVDQAGKTTRDRLVELILNNPLSQNEICKYLAISKGAFFNHKKRIGIKSAGADPTRYYLESIPSMIYPGGKRVKGGNKKKSSGVRVMAAPKPIAPKKPVPAKNKAKVEKKKVGRPKKKPQGFAIKGTREKAAAAKKAKLEAADRG